MNLPEFIPLTLDAGAEIGYIDLNGTRHIARLAFVEIGSPIGIFFDTNQLKTTEAIHPEQGKQWFILAPLSLEVQERFVEMINTLARFIWDLDTRRQLHFSIMDPDWMNQEPASE